MLLARSEAKAIASGYQKIRLVTNLAFASNIALYGQLGYEIERHEAFMGGTGIYMRKTVAGSVSPPFRHLKKFHNIYYAN